MALTRNNNAITSDRTPHSARLMPGRLEYWEVSYLPGICLEYDDAYMAMTIAEKPCLEDQDVALSAWDPQNIATWVRQGLWADILDLDIDEVRESTSRRPPPGLQVRGPATGRTTSTSQNSDSNRG